MDVLDITMDTYLGSSRGRSKGQERRTKYVERRHAIISRPSDGFLGASSGALALRKEFSEFLYMTCDHSFRDLLPKTSVIVKPERGAGQHDVSNRV